MRKKRIYPVCKAWHLGEGELKDYSIDVANEIQEGETISQADWVADPDELNFTNQAIDGTIITIFIDGAKAHVDYDVLLTVTSGTGKVAQIPILISGVDKMQSAPAG